MKENEEVITEKKYKPVIFINGIYDYHRQNEFQQNLLLKAMQITSDPKKLKEMVGLKTVAEVYRTLDKLTIRKEYHEALIRNNVDLDSIITGIKSLAECAEKDAVRLNAYKTFLRSLGLDEYKDVEEGEKKSWEDILKEIVKNKDSQEEEIKEYEVKVPEIPESERRKNMEELETGKGLYDNL